MTTASIGTRVDEVLRESNANPVNLLSNGKGAGERRYLEMLRPMHVVLAEKVVEDKDPFLDTDAAT